MGSFVSILPRPPAESFSQAMGKGRSEALQDRARLVGIQTALQQQQQQAALAPAILQERQAGAQEAQMRVAAMQQAQKDQQILSDAFKYHMTAPAESAQPSKAPQTADGSEEDESAPVGSDGAAAPTLNRAAAPPTSAADLHPTVAQSLPGIQPIADSTDLWGKILGTAAKSGLSPAAQMKFSQEILARKEALSKYKAEDLKQKAEQYDQVAGRGDAFVAQPDDYKQRHWGDYLSGLVRDGLMTQDEQKQALQQYPTYPGDQAFTYISRMHLADSQLMKRMTEEKTQANAESERKNREAQRPGIEADADQKVRANWASQLAAAQTPEQYAATLGEMPSKYASQLPQAFDPKTTPAAVRTWGQTPEQQVTTGQTAARNAQTAAHEKVTEQQGAERNAIARGRLAIEQQRTAVNGKIDGLTANEWQNNANKLASEGRGYVNQRAQIRTQLANGYATDKNGNPVQDPKTGKPMVLSGAQRQTLQEQIDTTTRNLQDLQWRTAQFLKIPKPPAAAIGQLKDGDQVKSPDGHVWEMHDGIVYPVK